MFHVTGMQMQTDWMTTLSVMLPVTLPDGQIIVMPVPVIILQCTYYRKDCSILHMSAQT